MMLRPRLRLSKRRTKLAWILPSVSRLDRRSTLNFKSETKNGTFSISRMQN